jgi:hypothetical protein
MAYIHHMKISDQYTKALDEGDFDTVARIIVNGVLCR